MRILFCLWGIFISCSSFSQYQGQYQILRWYQGKSAAVSITFDGDYAGQVTHALPILEEFDFKSTYFICGKKANFKLLKKAVKKGHEIGSRSFSGMNLSKLKNDKITEEIGQNLAVINQNFPKQTVFSFAYPFGVGGGVSAEDERIRKIVSRFHSAARGYGRAGGYIGDFPNFEAYDENKKANYDNYYMQTGAFGVQPRTKLATYESIVSEVIDEHGWFIPLYYAVETPGQARISARRFREQMELIHSREADLWVASYGSVQKYLKEREHAKLVTLSHNDVELKFKLEDGLPDEVYDYPLSLQVRIPDGARVKEVTQGGQKVDFIFDYRVCQFNAIPDRGEIQFTLLPPLE